MFAVLLLAATASACGGGGGTPSFSVTATSSTGGAISPSTTTVTRGATASFSIAPATGYVVNSVSGCGGSLSGNSYVTGPITAPCTVSATFARQVYAVTAGAGAGGSIGPASAQVEHGSTTTFTLSPLEGYGIAGATGCGGSLNGDLYTTGPITAACTVSASFVINRYHVTALAGPGGSIQPGSIEVEHGGSASFTIAPDPGYSIDRVSGCAGTLEGSQYQTGPIVAACTVEATFRLPSVSGTVFPAAGTGADDDVNDPRAPYASNDALLSAQFIGHPVAVGGFVNSPLHGPQGRSFDSGDEADFYQANLPAGQVIRLLIASEDVADDLDLWLVDLDGFLVDVSIDASAREESVVVPPDAAGEYYLVVRAWSGASNYLLVIDEPAQEARATMQLSDDFIPGELIVRMADGAPAASGGTLAQAGPLGSGRSRAPGKPQRGKLVSVEELRSVAGTVAAIARAPGVDRLLRESGGWLQVRDPSMLRKLETLAMVKALARDPTVAAVAPNYVYQLHTEFIPDDPGFATQWHFAQIGAPAAWTLATGTGVIVAVIDSGVLLGHPDLQDRLVEGHDFLRQLPGGDDPGDDPVPPGGSAFHGTHVAGTIAAATNNGIGVAGVAFGARIMPLRACDANGCTGYALEQALRYAAGLDNDSGIIPPQPAGVVNLSLGRQDGPALAQEQQVFNQLRDLDIFVVASAGNSSSSNEFYPAAYDNVIAVSAVDFAGQRAYYSNFGAWIDVAAPGGDLTRDLNGDGSPDGVLSTSADDREGSPQPSYRFLQGTSMAAPHVAGVAALMRASAPELRAQDIENLLRSEAITDDLGAPGRDDVYGWGLINALKAVSEALNAGGEPVPLAPYMAVSDSVVNFGATVDTRSVVFSNIGGGELAFGIPTEDSGGWLTLRSEEIAGELILTLSVNRSGLEDGLYVATVTMPSSANTVEVVAIMQVASLPGAAVGLQYVLLIDPDSMETRHSAPATAAGAGRQSFRIENVSPGRYLLVTGSDANNDAAVCDAGESCGFYHDVEDIVPIDVADVDIDGLEITSGYGVPGATPLSR